MKNNEINSYYEKGGYHLFVKPLEIPKNLLKAEVLEKRTPLEHPALAKLIPYIKTLKSGYNGEKTICYHLGQIPSQRFYIFHDLRLPYEEASCQLDFLLFSPKIIIILDSKNHSGKLIFEKNQMIQEYMDKRFIYENPISQADRHQLLLKYFFEKHKLPYIPIESLVVVSKSSTEVVISPGNREAEKKVYRASNVLGKMDQLYQQYNREWVDHKTLEKMKKLLLKKHTPLDINVLKKFDVANSSVITGVQCSNCLFIPMDYKRKNWICPICGFISQDVPKGDIKDYFLLGNPTFSNREIRSFLHLPSSRATSYYLSTQNFPYTGTTKGRIYYPPKDFL